MKKAQLFTIRYKDQPKSLGTYRCLTAQHAIAAFMRDQCQYAGTFKRSAPRVIPAADLVATLSEN